MTAEPNFGHPLRRSTASAPARVRAAPSPGWKGLGLAALLCSGVAWASLPRPSEVSSDQQRQWRALAIAPLSSGGGTGMRMAATAAVEPVDFVARRDPLLVIVPKIETPPAAQGPLRIRGQVGDGLYWSLRAAGASPAVAAQYLAALATEIDVGGDIAPGDSFDLIVGPGQGGTLLYAGLKRRAERELQLVRWTQSGRSAWVDASNAEQPEPVENGMMMPVNGHITSYFGNRYHPILHFTRFHAGIDIGAAWGSPIVAAADGRVASAGWAGGYGREVSIVHGGGIISLYGHMSEIVAQPGSFVRRGQLIGYVGSSGLSTGPHVHFEVKQGGTPVNPLSVRFVSAPAVDPHLAGAVQVRLKALLGIAARKATGTTSI